MRTRKFDRLRFASAINKAAADFDFVDDVILNETFWLCVSGGAAAGALCLKWWNSRDTCIKSMRELIENSGGLAKVKGAILAFAKMTCAFTPNSAPGSLQTGLQEAFPKAYQAGEEFIKKLLQNGICSKEKIIEGLKKIFGEDLLTKDQWQDLLDKLLAGVEDAAIAALLMKMISEALKSATGACEEVCFKGEKLIEYLKQKFDENIDPEMLAKIAAALAIVIAIAAAIALLPVEVPAAVIAGMTAALIEAKAALAAALVAAGLIGSAASADSVIDEMIRETSSMNNCAETTEIVGPPAPTEIPNETDGPPPSGYFDGGDGVNTGVD